MAPEVTHEFFQEQIEVSTPPCLTTTDLERASASYCALFGWQMMDRLELGALGVFHRFAWHAGGASAGAKSAAAASNRRITAPA